MSRRRTTGVALISVMLIVALCSALMYELLTRHSLVVAKTRQVLYGDQSRAYALGAEAFARQLLEEDWQNEDSRALDSLDEPWAQPIEPFEVDNGSLELSIIDLDRRFNLNSLSGTGADVQVKRLKTLLNALGLDDRFAELWKDWVDEDQQITGFGAEDGTYLLRDPPHRTANSASGGVSELGLLDGLDPDTLAAIRPHVSAVPSTTILINVNTADSVVLQSMSEAMTAARADSLVESARAYGAAAELAAEIPELKDSLDLMTVTSQFFEIQARAEVNGVRAELVSVVHRDPETGALALLSRNFGRRYQSPFVPDTGGVGDAGDPGDKKR
jgi:general secretion pathway protein K